jgi:SAM-dependent methyltransferase
MSVKSNLKSIVPPSIRHMIAEIRLRRDMRRAEGKARSAVFSEIYERNLWGGDPGTFSSGSGSKDDVIGPYIDAVTSLMRAERVDRVVDLGCGDFRVGRHLVSPAVSYVGCDVFPGIVDRNNAAYSADNVEFRVVDIVTDSLPDGDLCVIRQVFQHLSNDDIMLVLRKTVQYPLVLITDEQVHGDDAATNPDIAAFHGTRRLFGGGLRLERAPFNQKIEVVLDHSSGLNYGSATATYLRTVLIRHPRQ